VLPVDYLYEPGGEREGEYAIADQPLEYDRLVGGTAFGEVSSKGFPISRFFAKML